MYSTIVYRSSSMPSHSWLPAAAVIVAAATAHRVYIHTHTHTQTRARTHARMHARTHARTRARTHARTHTHTHTHTHLHTHTHTHIHMHIPSYHNDIKCTSRVLSGCYLPTKRSINVRGSWWLRSKSKAENQVYTERVSRRR